MEQFPSADQRAGVFAASETRGEQHGFVKKMKRVETNHKAP